MFGLGMTELLVILAIVLLIFGPKRLKNIGADLGNAIKGFRTAVTEDEEPKPQADPVPPEAKVIEGEAQSADQKAETRQESKV
jgi:sec-independent protein translocase protein TatA